MAKHIQVNQFRWYVVRRIVVSSALILFLTSCGSGSGDSQNNQSEAEITAQEGFEVTQVDVSSVEIDGNSAPSLGAAGSSSDNQAPSIEAISIGCDWVLESVVISGGESSDFTLIVDDESPLALEYSVSSDDQSIVTARVDSNGVFTLQGIESGSTTLPILVTDEEGQSDEILLSVVVN